MNGQTRPLSEITRRAIAALHREIGVADTIRFLNQFTTGSGDYTTERDELFRGLTLKELVAKVREAGNEARD